MVKITSIDLATIATLSSAVLADNCRTQYTYCGSTLLGMGKYRAQIESALREKGRGFTDHEVKNGVFKCLGGPNGDIELIRQCRDGCYDAGRGNNDSCF